MGSLRKIGGVTLVDWIRNIEVKEKLGLKESVDIKIRNGTLLYQAFFDIIGSRKKLKYIFLIIVITKLTPTKHCSKQALLMC